jgi:HK97 family phage major capsid protein
MAFSSTLSTLTGTQVGPLLVEPLRKESIAFQVTTVLETSQTKYRIPKITSDPSADWIGPNEEIEPSEAAGDEVVIEPEKIAGITYLANELVHDSNPDAARQVGLGLAGDIARKVDATFFGPWVTDPEAPSFNAHRPAGLESIAHANLQRIDANPASSIDPWTDGFYAAEAQGATVAAWVTTPAVALALAKLKTGTGSNATLLDFVDGRRTIHGAPVFISPFVTTGTVWGIPRARVFTVLRKDTEITIDKSVRFHHDQTAVRGIMRVAFGYPHTDPIVKIVD